MILFHSLTYQNENSKSKPSNDNFLSHFHVPLLPNTPKTLLKTTFPYTTKLERQSASVP